MDGPVRTKAREVHRAVEALPELERELISIAYWSGISHGEVADTLGIAPREVKARIRVALEQLADLIDD